MCLEFKVSRKLKIRQRQPSFRQLPLSTKNLPWELVLFSQENPLNCLSEPIGMMISESHENDGNAADSQMLAPILCHPHYLSWALTRFVSLRGVWPDQHLSLRGQKWVTGGEISCPCHWYVWEDTCSVVSLGQQCPQVPLQGGWGQVALWPPSSALLTLSSLLCL